MAYSLERFMTLEQIRGLVTADFEAVDRVVKQRLHSQVALVDQVATYIIYAGGKRLRPLLVLLAARACGHTGERHIDAAAIIEFIHTATLLHDDVVDGSSLRRGRETANEVFGNATSVLVGDFLYSRAFQMMVALDRMRIMQIMADATNAIAEGEVLQLMNARDPNTTRGALHRRHPPQDGAACSRPGAQIARGAERCPARSSRNRWRGTAGTSGPRFSWSTMRSTTRPTKPAWGNTWGTTWRRANPLCP